MSFRCEFCGKAQDAGVCPVRVVTKRKRRTYGFGTDIAEEKNGCASCAQDVVEETVDPTPKTSLGAKLGPLRESDGTS